MRRERHRSTYLFERILASDPSLDRLRSGLRALLTAALCAGAFLLLTRWFGLPYKLSLPGSVVPVVASIALVVGSLAAGHPWLSGALFLATIFNSFEMRRFGIAAARSGCRA